MWNTAQEGSEQAKRNLRIKYNRLFERLQETHKQQLLNCENDWRHDDHLEHLHRIPAHDEQMKLSQRFAAESDYEQAIQLRDSA
jgi:hypothetical protein